MAANSGHHAAPVRPSFAPLFEEGGSGSGVTQRKPASMGALDKHRANRAELGKTTIAPPTHSMQAACVSSHSSNRAPNEPPSYSGVSSPGQHARVVQHNVDEVERTMMADQAKVAHPQSGVDAPDVFDREYDRIVSEVRKRSSAQSQMDDEFDF